MANRCTGLWPALLLGASAVIPQYAFSADPAQAQPSVAKAGGRKIEEVVVTAERRQSTVQHTAVAITAFNTKMIQNFGIRNQQDLQAYIPSTTIQPYDISIRGVGRLYRALGGDPGVATYYDGVYSEDFGIASTEGGLFDLARVEVLRGPQVLYGRNGIGGGVNFITKKPNQQFSGEIRTVTGNYRQSEIYGYLNGPIIKNILSARFVGSNRQQDGTVKDLGGGPPLDSTGDENYSLALRWTPTDNFTLDIRGNRRDSQRIITAAQGAGAIVVSENGGTPDEITGGKRNTSAMVFGYRPVDPSSTCASLGSRTDSVTGAASPQCTIAGMPVFSFDYRGMPRQAQRVVPGVDPVTDPFARPNFAYGWNQSLADQTYIGNGKKLPKMTQSDLKVATNGHNHEGFTESAGYLNAEWDVNNWLTIKYNGGYVSYNYNRTTDRDHTSNAPLDMQFFTDQDNQNYQHEFQFLTNFDNVTITSGLFYYTNHIDQRLDFYSTNLARFDKAASYGVPDQGSAYANWMTARATYGTLSASATDPVTGQPLGTNPTLPLSHTQVGWNSARDVGCGIANLKGAVPVAAFSDPHIDKVCFLEGPWTGDTANFAGGNAPQGPNSDGTSFIWNTENVTKSYAVYSQGKWQINDLFALTLGFRWAEDKKHGEENLYLYREEQLTAANLFAYNVATGALNADGTPTGKGVIRFRGIPFSQSIYRSMDRTFKKWTYRANLDYTPSANTLFYGSITTGYRAGGFNLGYFSSTPTYDPETLTAYEVGYKGQLIDNTLQVRVSLYHYDYKHIALQFVTNSLIGTATDVINHPGAKTDGGSVEVEWLATDNLTLGGNWSYTDARYKGELKDPGTGQPGIVDTTNPLAPASVYLATQRINLTNGVQLPRVPKQKWVAYGTYDWDLSDGTLALNTTVSWTGKVRYNLTNSPLDLAQAYYQWNARLTWTTADRKITIAAFVNNITNQIGVRNMNAGDESADFLRTVVPTLPRESGVEFRYRFGGGA